MIYNDYTYCIDGTAKTKVNIKYYNCILGVMVVCPHHINIYGEWTYVLNGTNYSWIKTEDLYDTYEQAKESKFAEFYLQ